MCITSLSWRLMKNDNKESHRVMVQWFTPGLFSFKELCLFYQCGNKEGAEGVSDLYNIIKINGTFSSHVFSWRKKPKCNKYIWSKPCLFKTQPSDSHRLVCISFALIRAGKSKPVQLRQFASVIFTILQKTISVTQFKTPMHLKGCTNHWSFCRLR